MHSPASKSQVRRLTWICLALGALAFGAVGCPECEENGGGGQPPRECEDEPSPECTPEVGCINDSEVCISCECVPIPEGCEDPEAAECASNEDCAKPETCEGCTCVSPCDPSDECTQNEDCPGVPCNFIDDACRCAYIGDTDSESDTNPTSSSEPTTTGMTPTTDDSGSTGGGGACASGEGSPIDPLDVVTPEIVVMGTTLRGELTGEAGMCDDLCEVMITNNLSETVQYNAFALPGDVTLSPNTGDLPGGASITLSLGTLQCDTPEAGMAGISFIDPVDFIEYGIVSLDIATMLP